MKTSSARAACSALFLPVLFLSLGLSLGCVEEEPATTPTTTPSTDGSQTATQLAGSRSYCGTLTAGAGSALSGMGYNRSLTLNADGTYTFSVYFTDNVGCTTAQTAGGNNLATYHSAGTFVTEGTPGTPSTGSKVTFTVTSATMVAYPANVAAQNLRDWLNSGCGASPAFSSGTTTSTRTFTGLTCTGNGSYELPTPPIVGAIFKNIVYNVGNGTFTSGARESIYAPGSATYPTSYTDTWINY
jgi:hypothetical protein